LRSADAFNAFEAAGWEERAAGYQDFFGSITIRLVDPLLDAAGVGRGEPVLDVASGSGLCRRRSRQARSLGDRHGLADAMISVARRLHPDLEFRRGNAEDSRFSTGPSMRWWTTATVALPVRHHPGIRAFGVNAWSARGAGDRIIYEHDESFQSNEELFLVLGGAPPSSSTASGWTRPPGRSSSSGPARSKRWSPRSRERRSW
jgi:hypothetical protein